MSVIDRAGFLAGALGTALVLAYVGLAESGAEPEDSSSVIAAALVENQDSARLAAQLGLLAALLLTVFTSRLHGTLRSAAGPDSWFPTLALVGGVLIVGVLLVEAGLTYAASELESYGSDSQFTRLFIVWSWNSANLYAPGFIALLGGSTLVAFTAKAFPTWLRWTGAVLLTLSVFLVAVLRVPGLATAPGSLWVMLASVTLSILPSTTSS